MSFANLSGGGLDARHADDASRWWRVRWLRRTGRLDEIRDRMLAQLGAAPDAALADGIRAAGNAEALWALRHAWMQALQAPLGELLARQRMSEVSFMFAGLLDREKHARTSLEAPAARGLVRTPAQLRTDH